MTTLREAAQTVVDTYDSYRRRGVGPASTEYADFARSVDFVLRAALERHEPEYKPRAWAARTASGDYLRSAPSLPNNGDVPLVWEPLYDQAALDATVAAERSQAWHPDAIAQLVQLAIADERERCANQLGESASVLLRMERTNESDRHIAHVLKTHANSLRAAPVTRPPTPAPATPAEPTT